MGGFVVFGGSNDIGVPFVSVFLIYALFARGGSGLGGVLQSGQRPSLAFFL